MKQIVIIFFFVGLYFFPILGQESYFLTPQNKAYIYHTVRKSPILEHNIGRYIHFSGEEIKFPNGEINYDSTEQVIINNPELLKIYTHEIRRAPKGILAELANKVAIWELNTALQSHRNNTLVKDGKEADYQFFESLLIRRLPEKVLSLEKDKVKIHKRIERLSNPTLTFKDKVAMMDGMKFLTNEDKRSILKAYNYAINEFVSYRSQLLFEFLGGEADFFLNILTAAGDGSNTSGLFEEREKDERGRWNKGLPKAVGLFPYETYIGTNEKSKKKTQEVLPMGHTIHQFESFGQGRETNIHLDVWGYNSEKQTTVVITKSGKYYPLFGSVDSRFLTPDSTFGGGLTYYTLIHRVQKEIADLEERISGKRGIDYQIQNLENKRDETKLKIDKLGSELSTIRQSTITTKKRKLKTDSKRKERGGRQENVVSSYNALRSIETRIKELLEEKENILFEKQNWERKLQEMYDLVGSQWMTYKEKEGVYLFEDSTRFDVLTQEFTFPASDDKEVIDVRLIAIPVSHKNNQYDEVMLHINVTDAIPLYTSQLQLNVEDLFDVDQYELLSEQLFTSKDSIAVLEFFEALYDKSKDLKLIVRGGGVGKWNNNRVVIDYNAEELANYPGKDADERLAAKESSVFKRLRTTEVRIHVDRDIIWEVNSYTDPVRSNFKPSNKKHLALMKQMNLTGNQMLSAYRAYETLKALKRELNILGSQYLPMEKSAKVIDRLNKAIDKSRINVGRTSIKYKSF